MTEPNLKTLIRDIIRPVKEFPIPCIRNITLHLYFSYKGVNPLLFLIIVYIFREYRRRFFKVCQYW